jgi:hypothetical protein
VKAAGAYALVTGASSGIGRHLSKELARRGYGIVAVSDQGPQLQELKAEVEARFAVPVETLCLNLARATAAGQVFDHCVSRGLAVEVLVNNAGMLLFGEAVYVEVAWASDILQLHMNTPALLCRLFGEAMQKRGRKYILNVSSISAVMPYPIISLYGLSKTFLRYFSRALRAELKPQGVQVCCLLPGATATALYDGQGVNVSLARKLGVMGEAEAVARTGLKALFAGRAESIPGLLNKLAVYVLPGLPDPVVRWVYGRWGKGGE